MVAGCRCAGGARRVIATRTAAIGGDPFRARACASNEGLISMTWTITVAGDAQPVPAEDGETILDALLMHGVGFAYSCQAGNCGTCKCEYVSGEIAELEYSEHALSAAERSRGTILACRTQVWGDVNIRRLSAEEFVMHPSRIMQCRVESKEPLTHDVV